MSPPSIEAPAAARAPGEPAAATAQAEAAARAVPAVPAARAAAAPRWRFGQFLRVRVGTGEITLDLYSGRSKPQRLAGLVQELAPEGGDATAIATDLAQAIAGLEGALAALQARLEADKSGSLRGLRCDIVIDDSWMLYDVVRADLRGLSPRAADALIGASLADVAGVDASELASRWQPQGTSAYTLACGLPANALPLLEQALRSQGMSAGAIEGEFVHSFNAYRMRFDPKCAVIAIVRETGAQLAVLVDGVLAAMSYEFGVGAPAELEARGRGLLRVAGMGGSDAARFYAIAPLAWTPAAPWSGMEPAT